MADDITATVVTTELITATVDTTGSATTVSSVGIQGVSATDIGIGGLADVDAVAPDDGSVLVFKQITSKWTATRTLDLQIMEGGEF